LNAAHRKRLRFQLGQKDRFLDGLYQSGRFLSFMEDIFKKEGMPLELTRLPFVESSFNIRARSKVGASGIWQFMRSTARLFIKLSPAIDERNDPLRATEAAARLLRYNFES
jgi:membrane-bound lytic murein transglycosylase D